MIRLAAYGFVGWCVWRWVVTHLHTFRVLVDRLVEFGFFLAPLLLIFIIYRVVNKQPVVW